MKTIFKKIAAGLVLSSALLPAQAQEFRTSYFMQTSNFRHQMNPALIDAPYVSFPFMVGCSKSRKNPARFLTK